MRERVVWLIEQGLHQDNLEELIEECEVLLDSSPALYGALVFIFEKLADEYDDQCITAERYQEILETLKQPLINLLEADTSPAKTILEKLNQVMLSFYQLRRS